MTHSSFSAVYSGAELSAGTQRTDLTNTLYLLSFFKLLEATTTTHPAQITALAQHLVPFEKVISH